MRLSNFFTIFFVESVVGSGRKTLLWVVDQMPQRDLVGQREHAPVYGAMDAYIRRAAHVSEA